MKKFFDKSYEPTDKEYEIIWSYIEKLNYNDKMCLLKTL